MSVDETGRTAHKASFAAWKEIANSKGDMVHPWFTPVVESKHTSLSQMFTFTIRSEWKQMISLSIFGGIPNFSSTVYDPSRDLTRSMKTPQVLSPCSCLFWSSILTVEIPSACPLSHEAVLFFEAFYSFWKWFLTVLAFSTGVEHSWPFEFWISVLKLVQNLLLRMRYRLSWSPGLHMHSMSQHCICQELRRKRIVPEMLQNCVTQISCDNRRLTA